MNKDLEFASKIISDLILLYRNNIFRNTEFATRNAHFAELYKQDYTVLPKLECEFSDIIEDIDKNCPEPLKCMIKEELLKQERIGWFDR